MNHENEKPEIILPAEPAIEVQPAKKQTFSEWLSSREAETEIQRVLAANSGMTADRFIAGLSEALKANSQNRSFADQLMAAPVASLKKQVLKAAQFGLDFAPLNQQVYLVLYPEPTIVVSYRGQRALIERTGKVLRMSPSCIYSGDKCIIIKGSNESVHHEPCLDPNSQGEVIGFYAVAKMANNESIVEHMTCSQINAIKDGRRNKRAGAATPWETHYEEMAKKTVLRRLMKNFDVAIGIVSSDDEDDFSARNAPTQEKQASGSDLLAALKKKEQKIE